MTIHIDATPGELYLFPKLSQHAVFEFIEIKRNGKMIFAERGGGSRTRTLSIVEFEKLRTDPSGLMRVSRQINASRSPEVDLEDSDPLILMDEDSPGLNARQRDKIASSKKKIKRARTLRFYVLRYDEQPGISLSTPDLDNFIGRNKGDAIAEGFDWVPSASTVRIAIHECGEPDYRPLKAFIRPTKDGGKYWPPHILKLKSDLIDHFWSQAQPRICDAQALFFNSLNEAISSGMDLPKPSKETLRLWINAAECFETYERRYGRRSALRRFKGQQPAIAATRPLQCVMIDDTRVDVWSCISNGKGHRTEERPWLVIAVDVFSRMILAAVLTFRPPSIFTVVQCLKQMAQPKDFLPPELRNYKGADDGWGWPDRIIVDNAWQYASPSFQVMLEATGCSVSWAAIKTPQYKCHVEHAFDQLNDNLWHRLPSGIPFDPRTMAKLEINPRQRADKNLTELETRLWHVIIGICHVETNRGISKAPARAWGEALKEFRRPMIDDLGSLNRLLGQAKRAVLTTSGVTVDGEHFHNPVLTTQLLNDMVRFTKARDEHKSIDATGVVHILITKDLDDCGHIEVWNAFKRRNVRLPNVSPRFSTNLPWDTAKQARQLAERENLGFHSEDEKYKVRTRLLGMIAEFPDDLKFEKRRKKAREYARSMSLGKRPSLIASSTTLVSMYVLTDIVLPDCGGAKIAPNF